MAVSSLQRFDQVPINLKDGFNETGRRVFRWQKQASLADLSQDLETYLTR